MKDKKLDGFVIQTAQGRTAVMDGVSPEDLKRSLDEAQANAMARLIAYRDSLRG